MTRLRLFLWLSPLLLAWGLTAFHTVDQAEFVYVTQFGRPVAVYDGAAEAGLHVKWPWPVQSVQRVDRRVQVFDLPPAELPTYDPDGKTIDKMLTVDAFVAWRIADTEGVDRFIRTVGTPERARTILGQRVGSRLGAVVSHLPLEELVKVADPKTIDARVEKVRRQLLGLEPVGGEGGGAESLVELARSAYGIEVVDVRLRRFNYPEGVRPAIYARIRSERDRRAADYQSEGEKRAADITSAASAEAAVIRATAEAEASRLRKQADTDADRILNEAHSRDREFYTFLQKLDAYKKLLEKTSDVLLLSSRHELFDLLLKPPRMNGSPGTANGTPSPPGGR